MTTETPVADKALAAQGATADNLDDGAAGNKGAPVAPPAPSNEPPPKPAKKEGLDEETDIVPKAEPTAEEKAIADKAAADKADADKEAAGPLKEYSKYEESPAAAAAVELLKEAGIGPNAANEYFAKAIKSGNPDDIDVAGLEAKLGKAKTTLILAGAQAHFAAGNAKTAATVKVVHDIFGNEANWDVVRDWAKAAEKTDPKFKAQIDGVRSLLDEGGVRAEAGARELLRLYNAAPQTKGLGATKLAVGDNNGTVIGTVLTRAQYNTELKAAHERGAKPAEIKAIDARRKAGMKAGI